MPRSESAERRAAGRLGTGRLGTARLGTGRLGTGRLGTGRLGTGRQLLRCVALLRTVIAVVALAAGMLSACSGPSQQLPPAAELLGRSADAMRTVQSATINLTVDRSLTAIPVRAASGTLTAAGQAKGTATLDQGSGPVEFQFVIIDRQLYLKGPTGGFAPPVPAALAANLYDPAAVLSPTRGVANLLATAGEGVTEARESVNGVDAYRVRATLNPQAAGALVPGLSGQVGGLLWLDATTSRLVKTQLDVPGGPGGSTAPVTVSFADFDAPVTITPPS